MEFGKSATNFDSPPAESCQNGAKLPNRRNASNISEFMHCRLNWPEKGEDMPLFYVLVNRSVGILLCRC